MNLRAKRDPGGGNRAPDFRCRFACRRCNFFRAAPSFAVTFGQFPWKGSLGGSSRAICSREAHEGLPVDTCEPFRISIFVDVSVNSVSVIVLGM